MGGVGYFNWNRRGSIFVWDREGMQMIEIEKLVMDHSEMLKQYGERLVKVETILPEIKQDIQDSKRENKESNERIEKLVEKVYDKIDEICKTNGIQNTEIANMKGSSKGYISILMWLFNAFSVIGTGVVIALLLRR